MDMKIKLVGFFLFLLLIISCDVSESRSRNINLFQDSEAWNLVNNIKRGNNSQIEKICNNNPSLINFQEGKFGKTPLIVSIGLRKYKTTKRLLELGADPNLQAYSGETPLIQALSQEWGGFFRKFDKKYVNLLLSYGADPNKPYIDSMPNEDNTNVIEQGTSPLMYAIEFADYDLVKLLVEKGADINYINDWGVTPAITALIQGKLDAARYLIVESNAIVPKEYRNNPDFVDSLHMNDIHETIQLLLNYPYIYEIDTDEYRKKMDIVKVLERQGHRYQLQKSKLRPETLRYIKVKHPNDWQEFIAKF